MPASAAEEAAESQFISLANRERSRAFTVDGELTGIARRWSAKMASENRLEHNPNLANEVTQDWKRLGENVGVGNDPPQIHAAFMNSPGHRANIVDPDFTRIGVGVARGSDGRVWVTEVFMRLRSDDAPAAPPPTTTPAPAPTNPSPSPAPAPAPSGGGSGSSGGSGSGTGSGTTPTTRRARTTTTRPSTTPRPTTPTTVGVPATTTTVPVAAAPSPSGSALPAPAIATDPSRRLRLVLDQLVALDRGR
jgi:hypothetical protein